VKEVSSIACVDGCDELSKELKAFWELEAIGVKMDENLAPKKDILAMEQFKEKVKYVNDRYEVGLIWSDPKPNLANNYEVARKRFASLIKRFKRDENLYLKYKKVIDEQIQQGIAEAVPEQISNSNVIYYLPHQPVIQESKQTTKLRVVFDASSHAYGEKSLNDCLLEGANLNPELINVLLKFRNHRIVFTADIKQAFLQISLREQDRDAVRFLWCDNLDSRAPMELRMTRVLFGSKSSPFLLRATVKHHLEKYIESNPEMVDLINTNLYVDDLILGADIVSGAESLSIKSYEILRGASMELTKFRTNAPELINLWKKKLPEENIITSLTPSKVLGLTWNNDRDMIKYDMESLLEFLKNPKDTKRFVLQAAARIFDPLGLLAPFTVTIKILFQKLWELGIKWDDSLNNGLLIEWRKWYSQIVDLKEIETPRYYFNEKYNDEVELHAFCDASEKAYGAVVYVRFAKNENDYDTTLVMAKSRVAPIKKITLPRLELMGALVLCRLIKMLKELFGANVKVYAWSDSMVTLHWIKGHANNWKSFVCNRVIEIQEVLNPSCWSHCKGAENPADLLSRGASVEDLKKSDLWRKGPQWLKIHEHQWPKPNNFVFNDESNNEKRKQVNVLLTTALEPILRIMKFSKLRKLYRVTAWVLRFVSNIRKQTRSFDSLSAEEIFGAEIYWMKYVQRLKFDVELQHLKEKKALPTSSPIKDLAPFIDEMGLLCVGGRLQKSELEYHQKHPYIIPRDDKFCELLIYSAHERVMHSGVRDTLVELREKFWIIKGRQLVKSVIGRCFICKVYNARKGAEVFAPLPRDRIMESTPFDVIGIDFAGPVYIKSHGATEKSYICLFTCAVTRAIHLELVRNMNTESFILALKRFIGRRGAPRVIYSDNAKTFKRADKYLQELYSKKNLELQSFYEDQNIKWKFIVERAPWWGGFWERMVRSVKTVLKKSLGKALLTFIEMETMLIEVESVINSRLLTYVSSDDLEPPLTYWKEKYCSTGYE